MIHYFAIPTLALYLLAAALFLISFSGSRAALIKAAKISLALGFFVHSISLLNLLWGNELKLPGGEGDFYYLISWAVVVLYMLLRRKLGFPSIGAFVATAASLFLVSSSLLAHQPEVTNTTANPWLISILHVLPVLLAIAGLLFAGLLSAIFVIQERRIKRKQKAALQGSLPGLSLLDSMSRKFIVAGFFSMTLALMTGSIMAAREGSAILHADPTQWIALLMWAAMAFILQARTALKWSARRSSLVTILVSVLFIASFLITSFAGGMVHDGYVAR